MFGLKYFAEQKKGYISNWSWVIELLLHFYINNMGKSHSQELEEIARDLWDWSTEFEFWISAVHTPGICNVDADDQSRNFHDKHEWALNSRVQVFQVILPEYPGLNIDLQAVLATRLFHKPDVTLKS